MATIPGVDGNPAGEQTYEVQLLTPSRTPRPGNKWRGFAEFDNYSDAEYLVTDFEAALSEAQFGRAAVHSWVQRNLRIRQITTTREYTE